jgi:HK97 family phage prohead protease
MLAYAEVQARRAAKMIEEAAELPSGGEREALLVRAEMLLESLETLQQIINEKRADATATERRTFPHGSAEQEQRAKQAAAGVLSGYAAVFFRPEDPATQYRLGPNIVERVDKGAFDRALREKDDVRALFNHEPELMLGRTASGTLRLSVDRRGLAYAVDVNKSTTVGRDVLEYVRRGDVSGSSFSFYTDVERWSDEGPQTVRAIESVTLLDVGPVTFPGYRATSAHTG